MRILHMISGGDVGGAKTHVLSLLKGLGERHETRLVCFMEGDFSREARELGIPTLVYPGSNLFRLCRQVKALIDGQGFDVIHCHGAKGNAVGMLLRGKVNLPVLSTVHSDPRLDYLGRPLGNLTYGTINRVALRKMDYLVAVSDITREMLIGRGFDAQKVFAIYNGVDFSQPIPVTERKAFLRGLGLDWDESQIIFGIAARISPVKDMTTLIEAFSRVAGAFSNVKLLIAGDGEQRQELEQKAKQLCPAGSYHFAGWLQDVNSFYHALDVNLLTSKSETFPYAISEGARMGCATIATAVGGVPRMVQDGVTGFLITPGDEDALADRMGRLVEDAALRKQLGEAIREKVRREFSVDATVRTQEKIYETVLRKQARAAMPRDGVLISGSYGNGNVGDETILETIISQLRSHDPELPICVMSRRPRQTAQRNQVSSIYTFHPWKITARMKRAKLLISGGGSLIQNATSTRSLAFYLQVIRQAHRRGCKVMMYGCGIGPVTGKINRWWAGKRIDSNVDLITLRDPESKEELERLGVKRPEIRVTADPALLQRIPEEKRQSYEAYAQKAGLERQGNYCLFALRPWGNVHKKTALLAQAAEYVYEKHGLIPVLFMLEPGKDRAISQGVYDKIRCPKVMLPELTDGAVICALMGDMKLVVTMRLHALIFAAGQGTPLVGISYDPKVRGFMEYMEQNSYVSMEELSEENLRNCVDRALGSREDSAQKLDRLRSLAARNDALAWELMYGSDDP